MWDREMQYLDNKGPFTNGRTHECTGNAGCGPQMNNIRCNNCLDKRHQKPELLMSLTKVLILEDPRGPIYVHSPCPRPRTYKSLKIFEDSAFCNLHTVGY